MKSETRGTFPIPAIIIHHNDIVAKKQLQSIIHYMVLEWSKLRHYREQSTRKGNNKRLLYSTESYEFSASLRGKESDSPPFPRESIHLHGCTFLNAMNTGISPAYPSMLMAKSRASDGYEDKSTWINTVVSVVYLS